MFKLTSLTLGILVLSLVVAGSMLAGGASAPRGTTAGATESSPFRELGARFLSSIGLTAERWAGPVEGHLAAEEIREAAAAHGTVAEMTLVRLGDAGTDGKIGRVHLEGLSRDRHDGPLWAVVLTDSPSGLSDQSPNAEVFVNLLFLDPRSGEIVSRFEAAIVPGDL